MNVAALILKLFSLRKKNEEIKIKKLEQQLST